MDKLFNAISIIIGIVGGLAASLFGAWDKLLWTLAVIMTLDCITGIIKGIYTKSLSSNIGYKGVLKKVEILVIVALSNVIGELIGGNIAAREMVIIFYITNEGISVLENAAVLLPNMPKGIKEILLQLRGDGGENRN